MSRYVPRSSLNSHWQPHVSYTLTYIINFSFFFHFQSLISSGTKTSETVSQPVQWLDNVENIFRHMLKHVLFLAVVYYCYFDGYAVKISCKMEWKFLHGFFWLYFKGDNEVAMQRWYGGILSAG